MYSVLHTRRNVSLLLVSVMLAAVLACNASVGSAPTETPTPSPTPTAEISATATLAVTATVDAAPSTETPQPTAPVEPTSEFIIPNVPASNVDYDGIKFYRDNALAASWACEIVPAEIPDTDTPEALLLPSHFYFTFEGYPLAGTVHAPQIYLFPVRNFEDYNEPGIEVITKLQKFLKDRPANVSGSIPFLPIFPAAQAMRTQVAYLNFQNGSGMRFLTQYDQAPIPINNHEMFYTFQGITLDGQYYVSVIMPVSHPNLPADSSTIPGDDPAAFANNFPTYLQGIEQQLNDASASSFNPSLEMLDTMVQSLSIKQ
jgi:hypothetical protein